MIVYIPIFALSGVEGKMFHPMAFTVVTALLGAVILSVTFVPAAVALFLTGDIQDKENRVVEYSKRTYLPMLNWVLRNRALTITLAVTVMVLSGLLATRLGSEFVPSLNEGDIALHAIRIPGTSLTTAIEMQNELEEKSKPLQKLNACFPRLEQRKSPLIPCRRVSRIYSLF